MNNYDKSRLDDIIKNIIQLHYRMNENDNKELRDFFQYIKNFLYENKQYRFHKSYAHARLLYTYIKKYLDYYDKLDFNNKLININHDPIFEIPLVKPKIWD